VPCTAEAYSALPAIPTLSNQLKQGAIVKDIVAKADGVFLWVVLVVVSLLEGLSNRDEISYLQRRIDLLPQDFGEFIYCNAI
jgi:hypothetical protein